MPVEIRGAAFTEAKPTGQPLYSHTRLGNGDSAVIALRAVREEPGDAQQPDNELRQQFAAQIAAAETQSYAAGARADAKVVLNPRAID